MVSLGFCVLSGVLLADYPFFLPSSYLLFVFLSCYLALSLLLPRKLNLALEPSNSLTTNNANTNTQHQQTHSVLTDESAGKSGDLYIRSVCFSPDGKYLATGAEDKQIRVSFFVRVDFWSSESFVLRLFVDGGFFESVGLRRLVCSLMLCAVLRWLALRTCGDACIFRLWS